MRMQLIKSIALATLCCVMSSGCDRKKVAAPIEAQAPQDTSQDGAEIDPQTMDLKPLSQLIPDRPTHLATDSVGNIYWVQETPAGQDMLFVAGQDDIPHPTQLTTDSILAALGQRSAGASPFGAVRDHNGNIESIAVEPNEHVLFFFSGGAGKATCVCLGQFSLHDQSIQILAGTDALAAASGMGASISLAHGQIIKPVSASSDQLPRYWLWLHHSDAAVFFRFDPRSIESSQSLDLKLAFDQLSGAVALPNPAADSVEICAGEGQTLLLTDWHRAMLWRIDASGVATKWTTLLGLPRDLSELSPRPGGVAIAFAPAGELAVGSDDDGQQLKDSHFLNVQRPVMLAFTANEVIPIVGLDDIHGPPSLNIPTLKLQQLVPMGLPHEWIGYDSASGVLMRIKLGEKRDGKS